MSTNSSAVGVEMRGLRRSFGAVKALDDFDLDIRPGELVALLGPSGCGKTTALRVLSGLEDLDSGTVSVGGRDITQTPPNRRNMAMVFQSYSLFPHLTVSGNIDFALSMRKVPGRKRQAIIDHHLELVGLIAQRNRFPHEMSGGQQQRVALARALASNPDVLLLDEPLSALDAKVRVQLRDEIRRIQQELGTTTLFVTHDQGEALAMADRVGVMQAGRLEQLTSPRELYERPATGFVARFIGQTNELPGVVSAGNVLVMDQWLPALPGSITEGRGTALVRPERITVTPCEDRADGGEGRMATVRQLSFQGDHAVVHLAMAESDHEITAFVTARETAALSEGTDVLVGLDPVPVLVAA
ncbi:ABC transporter ATP-binding protein [Tessaracoccus sp. ZS01]|uniref:ABC transporter ATP-binding protein n=1 Tax=Tessaracoccus sp. ZS01 TaxID=1906324 RepID=UPI00096FAC3B|nr:ABC transporter ATP-binding protein [Tessaracoccus sp. ZS01]MCG6567597.1 ABC transporter ATP-binding protein [Tessaracoccus sp. ZS01]OMG55953.1 spermidine/putrescine ABC transporter ATP-binding protein [Tessaracoccus sp. ZS01]